MKVEGRVGEISAAEGTLNPLRTLGDGSLVIAQSASKYAEAARAGRLFYAANQTPISTSTTLNTTFVGLALCNPTGSGKILILHEFGYAIVKAAAGEGALALAETDETGFAAAITPVCTRHGYASSVAYVDNGATITAPVIVKMIATIGQGADTTQLMPPFTLVDLGGSIVLDPGRAIVTDTTVAAGATTIQFSYMWEEIVE